MADRLTDSMLECGECQIHQCRYSHDRCLCVRCGPKAHTTYKYRWRHPSCTVSH